MLTPALVENSDRTNTLKEPVEYLTNDWKITFIALRVKNIELGSWQNKLSQMWQHVNLRHYACGMIPKQIKYCLIIKVHLQ